jgi:hypothetical protein
MHACEVHAHETPAYYYFGGSLAQTMVHLSRSEFKNTSFGASCGVVPMTRRILGTYRVFLLFMQNLIVLTTIKSATAVLHPERAHPDRAGVQRDRAEAAPPHRRPRTVAPAPSRWVYHCARRPLPLTILISFCSPDRALASGAFTPCACVVLLAHTAVLLQSIYRVTPSGDRHAPSMP